MSPPLNEKPLKHPKAPKGFQLVCERYVEGTHRRTVIPNNHQTFHARGGLEVETVGSTGVTNTIRRSHLKQRPIGNV
ncbi:XRE family transcriptional regulator [Escherichia phage IMM-002]|uniref:XRE family transcriptional regulator n=1 Tax=Escherichia phage IMM-002 TaxID=2041760 RepID=A0A384WW86_9CAUD|nr:XRE family transcriptional regulator [Escherichia phage IMM-002]ATI17020.1 XRE family transcriptional regulator [Escherichia phage IMM-002]